MPRSVAVVVALETVTGTFSFWFDNRESKFGLGFSSLVVLLLLLLLVLVDCLTRRGLRFFRPLYDEWISIE